MYNFICNIDPKWLRGQDLNYIIELSNISVDGLNLNTIKDALKRKILDSFIC